MRCNCHYLGIMGTILAIPLIIFFPALIITCSSEKESPSVQVAQPEKGAVEKGKMEVEAKPEKKEKVPPKTVLIVPKDGKAETFTCPNKVSTYTTVYCGKEKRPCGTWEAKYSIAIPAFSIQFNEDGTSAHYKLWGVTYDEGRAGYDVRWEGDFPSQTYREKYPKESKNREECRPIWFLHLMNTIQGWSGAEGYLSFSINENFPDINRDGLPDYMPSPDLGGAAYEKKLYTSKQGCGRFLGNIFGDKVTFSKKKKAGLPVSIKTTSTEGQTQVRTYVLQDEVYICDNVRVDSGTFPCD